MSQQITKDHNLEALKVAASWPGADRATLVTLATVLAATGADHDGLSYFEALAASQPDQVLPLSLAGYFQVRAGEDIPAGLARLDNAASRDLGLAQYYRGLALAALPAEADHAAGRGRPGVRARRPRPVSEQYDPRGLPRASRGICRHGLGQPGSQGRRGLRPVIGSG